MGSVKKYFPYFVSAMVADLLVINVRPIVYSQMKTRRYALLWGSILKRGEGVKQLNFAWERGIGSQILCLSTRFSL
jgi:hypothetical protein